MSYFWYLTGPVPIKEIDNRYCEYISVREALRRGVTVSEYVLSEVNDPDEVTVVWYPTYDASVETIIIHHSGEEVPPWIRTYLPEKYFANLYFEYSDKRTEFLISYIKEYLRYAGYLELWQICVDNQYPMPPPTIFEQEISDLTIDSILEFLYSSKTVACLRVTGEKTRPLPAPWENDPPLISKITPEFPICFIPDRRDSLSRDELLRKVRAYVKACSRPEFAGHDWWHTFRVVSLAKKINEIEKTDEFKLQLIALLHDVVDEKFFDGDQTRALKSIFAGLNLSLEISEEVIDEVIFNILHLGFKGGFESIELSPEGKVVQDADRLDAIGAIGIARTFAYGGSKGQLMYDPDSDFIAIKSPEEYRSLKRSSINHFYEKLLLLKDRMNTETARRMAEKRHLFMENFLEEFFDEWEL